MALTLQSLTAGTNEQIRVLVDVTGTISRGTQRTFALAGDDVFGTEAGIIDPASDLSWNVGNRTIQFLQYESDWRVAVFQGIHLTDTSRFDETYSSSSDNPRMHILIERPNGSVSVLLDMQIATVGGPWMTFGNPTDGGDLGDSAIDHDLEIGSQVLIVVADAGSVRSPLGLSSLTAGTNEKVRVLGTLTSAVSALSSGGWLDNPNDASYDTPNIGLLDAASDVDWDGRVIGRVRFRTNNNIVLRRNVDTGSPFTSDYVPGDTGPRMFIVTETPDGVRRHEFDGRMHTLGDDFISFRESDNTSLAGSDINVDYPVGSRFLLVIADEGSVRLATDDTGDTREIDADIDLGALSSTSSLIAKQTLDIATDIDLSALRVDSSLTAKQTLDIAVDIDIGDLSVTSAVTATAAGDVSATFRLGALSVASSLSATRTNDIRTDIALSVLDVDSSLGAAQTHSIAADIGLGGLSVASSVRIPRDHSISLTADLGSLSVESGLDIGRPSTTPNRRGPDRGHLPDFEIIDTLDEERRLSNRTNAANYGGHSHGYWTWS